VQHVTETAPSTKVKGTAVKGRATHTLVRAIELTQRILRIIEQNENITQGKLAAKLKSFATYNTLRFYLSDMQELLFIERSEVLDATTKHLTRGFLTRYKTTEAGQEFLRLISGSLSSPDQ
jgi:hypothetical protein